MQPDVMRPGLAAGSVDGVASIDAIPDHGTAYSLGGNGAMDTLSCWERARSRLKRDLGEQIFSSWFGRMEFDGIEAGAVQLSVPTRFLKTWIEQHYRDRLVDLWRMEREDIGRVEIIVRGASTPTRAAATPVAPALPCRAPSDPGPTATPVEPVMSISSDDCLGSPLDRRLTFATFVVGRSNELAHVAARKVATAPDTVTFNPLFVHANVGLGKTHLLHALAHAARESGRRVLYLTAERFMYGFVSALKSQSAIAFKEQLRGIDLLLIDDVQFLQGKHVQAEFGHTLNALLDGSRQVVVAGDRAPSDLETLDERMKSRLAGGLVVEVGAPDEELRLHILKTKMAVARERYPNLSVPESVLGYVAHAVRTNGRDLDGAFNRLLAHNQLTNLPLGVEMAEECLRDLIRAPEPKKVKIEDIQRIVGKHYAVSRQDILSSRRTRNVVLPRQIAMYLAKALTPRSLPEIGRHFGGRDHTTVLHAVRKVDALVKSDTQLAQELELLKRLLQDV
jgi:chromosomal replication initiator protein